MPDSPNDQVSNWYRNVAGKEGDTEGLNFWSGKIANGGNASDVYNSFLGSVNSVTGGNATTGYEDASRPYTPPDLTANDLAGALNQPQAAGNSGEPLSWDLNGWNNWSQNDRDSYSQANIASRESNPVNRGVSSMYAGQVGGYVPFGSFDNDSNYSPAYGAVRQVGMNAPNENLNYGIVKSEVPEGQTGSYQLAMDRTPAGGQTYSQVRDNLLGTDNLANISPDQAQRLQNFSVNNGAGADIEQTILDPWGTTPLTYSYGGSMPGVASPDGADAASTAALLRSTGDPQQVNSTQVEESIKNNYVRMPDGSSMSIGQLTAPHYDYGDDPGFGGLVKKFAPTLAGGLMSIAGVPWYARLAASAAMGNKG